MLDLRRLPVHGTLWGLLGVCALVSGCAATGTGPVETDEGLAPVAEVRRARLAEAMAGLRYDGERVQPDGSRAPGTDPAASGDHLTQAWHLLEGNRFVAAIRRFSDAVLSSPTSPEALYGLGRGLLTKGKAPEALAAFSTALTYGPDLDDARFWRGIALQQLDRFDEAGTCWEELLRRDPDHGEAHARLAVVRYYSGDLEAARDHYGQARRLAAPVPSVLASLLENGSPAVATVRQGGAGAAVGPQVRIDAGGNGRANEISAAGVASPAGGEIVATWNDYRSPGGEIRVGVATSVDGGATWTDQLVRPPVPNQSGVEGDPMTAYDRVTGDLWVGGISFLAGGGVFVARKPPGSTTFEPAVMALAGGADKGWMASGAAPSGGPERRLYVTYDRGVQWSGDLGQTWSAVRSLGFGLGFLPRVGAQGRLYVSFWDTASEYFLLRSDDGGATLSAPLPIATRLDPWGTHDPTRVPGTFRVPPLIYLALDPADETLYGIYFDTTSIAGSERDVDLYFTRSTDQGDSWTTPRILGPVGGQPGDQFFPWLEVDDDGHLHMVFFDTRNTAQTDEDASAFIDAYYATSADRGDTWTETRLTSIPWDSATEQDSFNQFIGDYLGLAIAGKNVFPVYLSSQNGDSDVFTHLVDASGPPLFSDGFESGDTSAWSLTVP